MTPHALKNTCFLTIVAMVWAIGAPDAAAENDAAPKAKTKQVKVVTSVEEVPPFSKRNLKKIIKALPEEHKLQITVSQFVDMGHGDSSNQLEPYASSAVPINADDQKNGQEMFFVAPRRSGITRIVTWVEGVKDGPETLFSAQKRYKTTEIPWKDGKIHGVRKTFNAEGKVMTETNYEHGEVVGVSKEYDEQGRLVREVGYKDGKKHGKRVEYWAQTGERRRVVPYKHGQAHGEALEYHLNGELKRRVPAIDGQLHGHEQVYNDEGELIDQRWWLNGTPVSKREYEAAENAKEDDQQKD